MSPYSAFVMLRKSDEETDQWLRLVREGPSATRDKAVASLAGRALASNDPDRWAAAWRSISPARHSPRRS